MFDKNLVHAIVGGKDPDCGSAELSVNRILKLRHGSLLLAPSYFRPGGHNEVIQPSANRKGWPIPPQV
jgi:hypothetical protein